MDHDQVDVADVAPLQPCGIGQQVDLEGRGGGIGADASIRPMQLTPGSPLPG
jgi:hypothetical protein